MFHLVYSPPEEARLTGSALYAPDSYGFVAFPSNQDDRWHIRPCQIIQIPLMENLPNTDRLHGFAFHEACWSLLKGCHQGKPVEFE